MLLGQYQTKINQKGRVALPVKFKRTLGNKIILTAGYEQSLMIVTQKDWQVVVDRINQGSTLGPTRETDRFLLGNAHEVQLDKQGRFVIPKHLREYADLAFKIVFVGVGNRAEIWNQTNWETYSHGLNKKVKKLGEKLDQTK
ncbi:MAG: division/cell wall cluster transcriptional repressor MraZ [Patescibacteria group bacterium]|nr:division/cell wall cluster transcriptional repressor MraZ [Patescibacteria group bacterium]